MIALVLVVAALPADEDERALAERPTLPLIQRLAVVRNPELAVFRERASAALAMAESESSFSAPELMVEARQVPASTPWALPEAQMLSLGVRQSLPVPGVRAARRSSGEAEASVEHHRREIAARELRRTAAHAFLDFQEASARHAIHASHAGALDRLAELAQARMPTGGKLDDVLQAQRDRARLEAELVVELASVASAKLKLNALLDRPLEAPLGPPPEEGELPAESEALSGVDTRPEVRAAEASRAAAQASQRIADQEAAWPRFTLGAFYEAPTQSMPIHGYSLSVGVELPWLWGGRRDAVTARSLSAAAAEAERAAALWRASVEVASAKAALELARRRHAALKTVARPAAQKALEVALAGYRSGQGDARVVLEAERAIVELDVELVSARSAVFHALADLEWAAGRANR